MSEAVIENEGRPAGDSASPEGVSQSAVPFFLVGTRKFVALHVVTLGLYQMYWFYRQWRKLRDVGGEEIWPIPRTIFCGLFSYWLFARVDEESDRHGLPGLLTTRGS
jgi:hypothetical protein